MTDELKVTTKSGRVYRVKANTFMRCGEGVMPGQWFPNNEWVRFSVVENLGVGKHAVFWSNGVYADPDLWVHTSRIVSIEHVERSDDE